MVFPMQNFSFCRFSHVFPGGFCAFSPSRAFWPPGRGPPAAAPVFGAAGGAAAGHAAVESAAERAARGSSESREWWIAWIGKGTNMGFHGDVMVILW